MTLDETLRVAEVRTADNGLSFGSLEPVVDPAEPRVERPPLERMVHTVPRTLIPRLGQTLVYFVPWLYKKGRTVSVATAAPAEADPKRELCHHLDVKPTGNLLLIGLHFYENDTYGLAMEFFDKVAYLAALERDGREDFYNLLRAQWTEFAAGELTPETWEWRQALAAPPPPDASAADATHWRNYEASAESDALGLYMAALFTDVFYEDLFEEDEPFPALAPEALYQRVRGAERLYPANRGYNLQVVRQKKRRGGR